MGGLWKGDEAKYYTRKVGRVDYKVILTNKIQPNYH